MDLGSGRHSDLKALSVGSVALCTLAVPAPARLEVGAPTKVLQITQRGVTDEDHRSSAAAVTAIWPAARDMRFAAKARGAIAARSGLDVDSRSIVQHRGFIVTAGARAPTRRPLFVHIHGC
jgi:hypothetical protein